MRARRATTFIVAGLAAGALASTLPAQGAPPDSAAIYLLRAHASDSSSTSGAKARALPLWLRAVELYHARGDTLNEAEALLGEAMASRAAGLLPDDYMSAVLPLVRRAASLYLAKGARKEAADALETLNVQSRIFSSDSVRQNALAVLALRRGLHDQAGEARALRSMVFGWLSTGGRLDSALAYARQSWRVALASRDTLTLLLSLNSLGLTFARLSSDTALRLDIRRAWRDSSSITFREGVRLARVAGIFTEENAGLVNLLFIYQTPGPNADCATWTPHSSTAARCSRQRDVFTTRVPKASH